MNETKQIKRPEQYLLSFTTGAALRRESVAIAELKSELDDWAQVKAYVLQHNTFQSRTVRSLKNIYGEISRHLQCLNYKELKLLATGTEAEQKQLLWLAICRRYKLIADFSMEVLVHQFDTARFGVSYADYDAFFNGKAEWHENLNDASEQTKAKARQVLFKMCRECGLINEQNEIARQQISPAVLALLRNHSMQDLNVFPGVDI